MTSCGRFLGAGRIDPISVGYRAESALDRVEIEEPENAPSVYPPNRSIPIDPIIRDL